MKQVWICTALLLVANTACAASFDCDKATTKIEKIICADAGLSKLDEDLSAAYSKGLKESSDSSALRQQQRGWIKERNGCADAQCVKHAYDQRLSSLSDSGAPMASGKSTKQDAGNNQRYHFQLTKGAGTPVCDAYLERLNTTEYKKPPYCDRQESNAVKGFTKLNRVRLSPKDVRNLYPIIWAFQGLANQKNLDWADMNFQQRLTQTGQFRLTDVGVKGLQMYWDEGWAKIWRYDPPVDIDNNGSPDNVEIWHGAALPTGVGGRQCGDDGYPITHYGTPIRQPQIAFVITENGNRLDVIKTENVFAHPKGGYRFYSDFEKKWKVSGDFRPIGKSIGIFKYRDLYYFDTFFDSWGDFENKRRGDKQIGNTLAVFLHKDGKTKQVCEYLMTDNGTRNDRGTK